MGGRDSAEYAQATARRTAANTRRTAAEANLDAVRLRFTADAAVPVAERVGVLHQWRQDKVKVLDYANAVYAYHQVFYPNQIAAARSPAQAADWVRARDASYAADVDKINRTHAEIMEIDHKLTALGA